MRQGSVWLLCLLIAAAGPAAAETFAMPPAGADLIGVPRSVEAQQEDTLLDIARAHSLGYEEITKSNPGVDPWMPGAGVSVFLPKQRILPRAPREGIVVNLAEHRLYYFAPASGGQPPLIYSYPVAIGKMDWNTPLGVTRITQKVKNPTWTPPQSVREARARQGEILPPVVPPGPDNPLGHRAMRLAIPGGAYLIHGTNRPAGIGMQATAGCMRLYPEDIEKLFDLVPVNTKVNIVNQPFKIGWLDGVLYVEVHPPLQEDVVEPPQLTDLTRLIVEVTRERMIPVDWTRVQLAFNEARGVPVAVSADPALFAGAGR